MSAHRRAVIFLGPTLPRAAAERVLPEADYREPAGRGDILRAALAQPRIICLIDGYFEHRLAVQHKEILWALKHGIRVHGASSMGALRAAELDVYGMVGSGAIYRAFATQELDHDDEVAVVHGIGPSFQLASDALVNIRATLKHAADNGVLSSHALSAFLDVARGTFYAQRSYSTIVVEARKSGVDEDTCRRFEVWLREPQHRIDQKRLDAEEALAQVRDVVETDQCAAPDAEWDFPFSSTWGRLWTEVTEGEKRL